MIAYLLIGIAQTTCLIENGHYQGVFNTIYRYPDLRVPAWILRSVIASILVLVWPLVSFDIFFSTIFKGY